MRDKERTACREAAGDGAIDEGDSKYIIFLIIIIATQKLHRRRRR